PASGRGSAGTSQRATWPWSVLLAFPVVVVVIVVLSPSVQLVAVGAELAGDVEDVALQVERPVLVAGGAGIGGLGAQVGDPAAGLGDLLRGWPLNAPPLRLVEVPSDHDLHAQYSTTFRHHRQPTFRYPDTRNAPERTRGRWGCRRQRQLSAST